MDLGSNGYGLLGVGQSSAVLPTSYVPLEVIHPEGDTWDKLFLPTYLKAHSSAIDSSGRIYVWGYNSYGQLGLGDTTTRMYLNLLNHPEGDIWTDIARLNGSFTMIDSSSRMYVCGYGMYGMLGMDTYTEFGTSNLDTPTLNPYFTDNNLNLINSTIHTRGVLVNV